MKIIFLYVISALIKLRGTPHVDDELEEMRREEAANQEEAQISMLELLKSSSLRLPLVISVVMHLSQQLSGINVVSNGRCCC